MITEICVDSVHSAVAAQDGGAERIELCMALSEGGVTPSLGLVRGVRREVSLAVYTMIRPRGGGFHYSDSEFEVMLEDIRMAREEGADGIVFGTLTEGRQIDLERTRRAREAAGAMKTTFHRAFDLVAAQEAALEQLVSLGVERVLTSGGASSALHGAAQLQKLTAAAQGRISILAGGGIRTGNVRELVLRSGVTEVHSALSHSVQARDPERSASHSMGAQGSILLPISAEAIRAFRGAFHGALAELGVAIIPVAEAS